MGVRTTESVTVPAEPAKVFPYVAELDRYPDWMRLVHRATRLDPTDDHTEPAGPAAWDVEIRAQVGPFARSKRLRMIRSLCEEASAVEFERQELDGKRHARWWLRVELEPATPASTVVTMHLVYDGALWTGGLLDRVLDDEIRKGRAGLTDLVGGGTTH